MKKRPLVCALVHEGLHLFELGIVAEVFGLPRPEFDSWYDFKIISAKLAPIPANGGISVQASYDLDIIGEASLIVIPGWSSTAKIPAELSAILEQAYENNVRFASICSGAFLLAELGFLEGKTATTHWKYAEQLQLKYPNITVDENVLYVDEGQVLTSAGSAAGIDMCLHVVRQAFGSDIANQVARRLVLPAYREGGQAQFIPRPMPKERGGKIAPLLDEIRLNLNDIWSVDDMANKAGLTPRTLLRRFKETVGESPQVWLTSERIERSKELLESTRMNTTEIAEASGFLTPETLRHHFKKKIGISPMQYRSEFGQSFKP